MQKEICLNLAEVVNGIYEREGTLVSCLKSNLDISGYTRFNRIYIGSSFCATYFLKMTDDMMKSLCLLCEKEKVKFTLVLPMFSERYLTQAKERIQQLIHIGGVYLDEITVNDWGMMEYLSKHSKKKLNMGRLFMKDYRDKRYREYFALTLRPKIFNSRIRALIQQYPIYGMEFDLTHEKIDMSGAWDGITVGFHYPYCYQTVGNICEIASSGQTLSYKFRPNSPCHMECEQQQLTYESQEGHKYIKRGRAVYFRHPECIIENIKQIRLIYTPDGLRR